VSKRKDSAYRSGRSSDWLKMKNSDAPAVKREAEEELVKGAPAMSVAPPGGQDRIMIYGPKTDGAYIVEFRMADGESLAISVPGGEARVLTAFSGAACPMGWSCRTFREANRNPCVSRIESLLTQSAPGEDSREAEGFSLPFRPLVRLAQVKNSNALAAKREAEEDWGKRRKS